MNQTVTTSELIDSIYQASLDRSVWSSVLRQVAHNLNAQSALIRLVDHKKQGIGFSASFGYEQSFINIYAEHYIQVDPFQKIFEQVPDGTVFPQQAILPMKDYKNSEFYNDFVKPQEKSHAIGGVFLKTPNTWVQLGIQRNIGQPLFEQQDANELKLILPHLKRVISLNKQIEQIKNKNHFLGATVDHYPFAAVLLDYRGYLLGLNRSAEKLIINKLFNIKGKELTFYNQSLNNQFYKTVGLVINGREIPDAFIRCKALNGDQYRMFISPFKKRGSDFAGVITEQQRGLLVAIFPETTQIKLEYSVCNRLFEVTKAEFEIVQLLINGMSIEEIVHLRGVSESTIRSQLKSLFKKTETKSQSDLVQFILSQFPQISNNG